MTDHTTGADMVQFITTGADMVQFITTGADMTDHYDWSRHDRSLRLQHT